MTLKNSELQSPNFDGNVTTEITGTNVIVKKSPNNCEKYVYTQILPEFARLQSEKRILDPFRGFAMCYEATKNGDLLIDDLQKNGFKNAKCLDHEHVKIVMEEFGKLHATSLALRAQKSEKFEEFSLGLKNDFLSKAVKSEEDFKYVAKVVKNLNLEEFHGYVCGEYGNDMHFVVVHGQSSMENLLFKYQKHSTVPAAVCFPNWKMARIGSPALDLSYFLFTSTDKEFRRNHYEYMLQVYYSSLSTYLHLLGSNPTKVFPYSTLLDHMKKYSVYVLYMIYYVIENDKSKDQEFNDITITEILEDLIKYKYL